MKEYLAELHIHTVLSPCGDLLMTPANILTYAQRRGIQLIAITDHNSAENVAVTLKQAPNYGVHVFPGMEIETREEVHLVALFDQLEQVLALQELVYQHLPDLENDETYFGPQLICDLADEYVGRVTRLLAVSMDLSLEDTVTAVEGLGGLVYPAHVDRQRNSILTQLGFIPPDLHFPVVEVSTRYPTSGEENSQLTGYTLIPANDVHYLHDLHGTSVWQLEAFEIAELKKAIYRLDGRSLQWRRR